MGSESPNGFAWPRPTLLLIDHSAIFWQCYHSTGNDEPADAPATRTETRVRRICEAVPHQAVRVLCDSPRNWRHDLFPQYKANREAKPPEVKEQLRRSQRLLVAAGFELHTCDGYEADDLIATAVRQHAGDWRVIIATADKDLAQLLNEYVEIFGIRTDTPMRAADVPSKFGVRAEQLGDYLALVGDASDNIPGAPSIGPTRAAALLTVFRDLDGVLSAAKNPESDIKPSQRKALLDFEETVRTSRKLVALADDAPLDLKLTPARVAEEAPGARMANPDELLGHVEAELAASTPKSEAETEPTQPEPQQAEPIDTGATMAQTQETNMTMNTNPIAEDRPKSNGAPAVAAIATPTQAQVNRGKFSAARATAATVRTSMRTVVTGRPGIGKTFLVSTIPGVFILPIEDGLRGISPDHHPTFFNDNGRPIMPTTLRELYDAIDVFAREVNAPGPDGKRPHRHFAIDGLTGIESLVHREVLGKEKVEHMEAKEYRKLWYAAEPLMVEVQRRLDAVRAQGTHIWLIAHSAEVIDAASTTGEVFRRWDLLLKGGGDVGVQARNMWRAWSDNVFFIDWSIRVRQGDKKRRAIGSYEARVLYTRESATHFAKCRDRLPPELPADWASIARALAQGSSVGEAKLRVELDSVMARLSDEDRAELQEDLKTATGANALARILSRAQGMAAIAADQAGDDDANDNSNEEGAAAAAE